MRFGLFGKLQSKRDFIAVATPRSFLSVWEPWLQGCISSSRMQLGDKWQDAFLTAPIWRFWLGAEICGTTITGAIMPSMDGVGRYFPLTVVGFSEPGAAPPPPEMDAGDGWFSASEDFLFSTLEPGRSFEQVSEALANLPAPATPVRETPASIGWLTPLQGVVARNPDSFANLFQQTRKADYESAYANMSFWWTAGGRDYAQRALATPRMPDAQLYAGMLTGDFASFVQQPAGAS